MRVYVSVRVGVRDRLRVSIWSARLVTGVTVSSTVESRIYNEHVGEQEAVDNKPYDTTVISAPYATPVQGLYGPPQLSHGS